MGRSGRSPIRARDRKGQDFEMAAMLVRGKLVAFYERDGIVYRNPPRESATAPHFNEEGS